MVILPGWLCGMRIEETGTPLRRRSCGRDPESYSGGLTFIPVADLVARTPGGAECGHNSPRTILLLEVRVVTVGRTRRGAGLRVDQDALVIEHVRNAGADLNKAVPIDFFVYFRD